jgi:uncharacterized protein YqgV (UPF0045/DUF77 family)
MASELSTPSHCVADFCLVPIGTPTASVSQEVAAVQKFLESTGLTFEMHSAGTTVGMNSNHHSYHHIHLT